MTRNFFLHRKGLLTRKLSQERPTYTKAHHTSGTPLLLSLAVFSSVDLPQVNWKLQLFRDHTPFWTVVFVKITQGMFSRCVQLCAYNCRQACMVKCIWCLNLMQAGISLNSLPTAWAAAVSVHLPIHLDAQRHWRNVEGCSACTFSESNISKQTAAATVQRGSAMPTQHACKFLTPPSLGSESRAQS